MSLSLFECSYVGTVDDNVYVVGILYVDVRDDVVGIKDDNGIGLFVEVQVERPAKRPQQMIRSARPNIT